MDWRTDIENECYTVLSGPLMYVVSMVSPSLPRLRALPLLLMRGLIVACAPFVLHRRAVTAQDPEVLPLPRQGANCEQHREVLDPPRLEVG